MTPKFRPSSEPCATMELLSILQLPLQQPQEWFISETNTFIDVVASHARLDNEAFHSSRKLTLQRYSYSTTYNRTSCTIISVGLVLRHPRLEHGTAPRNLEPQILFLRGRSSLSQNFTPPKITHYTVSHQKCTLLCVCVIASLEIQSMQI